MFRIEENPVKRDIIGTAYAFFLHHLRNILILHRCINAMKHMLLIVMDSEFFNFLS
jgi:hypothetical protein